MYMQLFLISLVLISDNNFLFSANSLNSALSGAREIHFALTPIQMYH